MLVLTDLFVMCRFGQFVSGLPPVTRQMRINNTAPTGLYCPQVCNTHRFVTPM